MRVFSLLLLAGTALGFNVRFSTTSHSSTFAKQLSGKGMSNQIRGEVLQATSVDQERYLGAAQELKIV
jgi:hypothetical protein